MKPPTEEILSKKPSSLEELKVKIAEANLEPIPEQVAGKIDELFFKYVENQSNTSLRNQIVLKNQALVAYIINKYYSGKKELKERREDLLQEGVIGLLSAIDGYKPELGFRFSTYATWWIRQAVNAYLQTMSPVIHIPSHVRTAQNKVARIMASTNCTYEDAIKKVATEHGYSERMIASVSAAMLSKNVISMDAPGNTSRNDGTNGNDFTFGETLQDSDKEDADSSVDRGLLLTAVKKSLRDLSLKERYILLLRFDIVQGDDLVEANLEETP